MSNPLTDLVPARYRKKAYAVVAAAALVFGVYQASEGDWGVFVASLLGALTSGTAASNVRTSTGTKV